MLLWIITVFFAIGLCFFFCLSLCLQLELYPILGGDKPHLMKWMHFNLAAWKLVPLPPRNPLQAVIRFIHSRMENWWPQVSSSQRICSNLWPGLCRHFPSMEKWLTFGFLSMATTLAKLATSSFSRMLHAFLWWSSWIYSSRTVSCEQWSSRRR